MQSNGFSSGDMKHYRILLFILVSLFAPRVVSAADVTITSLSGAVADFHPIFAGASANVSSFITNQGTNSTPFSVTVGKNYDVNKLVNGVIVKIGTVSWNASAVPTYTPVP